MIDAAIRERHLSECCHEKEAALQFKMNNSYSMVWFVCIRSKRRKSKENYIEMGVRSRECVCAWKKGVLHIPTETVIKCKAVIWHTTHRLMHIFSNIWIFHEHMDGKAPSEMWHLTDLYYIYAIDVLPVKFLLRVFSRHWLSYAQLCTHSFSDTASPSVLDDVRKCNTYWQWCQWKYIFPRKFH